MEKELADDRPVAREVLFVAADRSKALRPKGFGVIDPTRQPLAAKHPRMDPNDEDFFVIAAVEHPDATSLGKTPRAAPQKVVVEFFARGSFEIGDLETGRVYPAQHRADRRIFSGGVHRLKDQKQREAVVCVEQPLVLVQRLDALFEGFCARLGVNSAFSGMSGRCGNLKGLAEGDEIRARGGSDGSHVGEPLSGGVRSR